MERVKEEEDRIYAKSNDPRDRRLKGVKGQIHVQFLARFAARSFQDIAFRVISGDGDPLWNTMTFPPEAHLTIATFISTPIPHPFSTPGELC